MAENVIVRSDLDELTDPELTDFINQLLQNSEIKILSKTIQSMYSKLQNQLNIYKSQLIDASNFGKSLTHKEKKVNKEYQSLRSQARTTLGSQKDMDSLAYQFSKFMFTIHKLQSSVAALSNQQIRLVYVYKSKRSRVQITDYTMSLHQFEDWQEIFKVAETSGHDLTIRFNALNTLRKRNDWDNFNADITDEMWLKRLEQAYEESFSRGKYSRSNSKHPIRKASIMLVLWNLGGWHKAFVSSAGSFQEALMGFMANPNYSLFQSNSSEILVSQFMTGGTGSDQEALENRDGVLAVDNRSGLFAGDIKTSKLNEQQQQIQYAVKGLSASMMGYKQVLDFITAFLSKDSITIKKMILDKGHFINGMVVGPVNELITEDGLAILENEISSKRMKMNINLT